DVECREVPIQACVAILELVAHEHDLAARAHGVGLGAGTEVVAALTPAGCWPHGATDQAEQRALAAAVRADDAPVLAAMQLPADVAQDRHALEGDVDVLEADQWGERHACEWIRAKVRAARVYLS